MKLSILNQWIALSLLALGLGCPQAPAAAQAPADAWPPLAAASEAANPHLDHALRQLASQAAGASPPALRSANPAMSIGQGPAGATVLVRVLASHVEALLPALRARGFVAEYSDPPRHLVEGWLPVRELVGLGALASQGLLGAVTCWAPAASSGRTTSQADYVLEARRARATAPGRATGRGVRVGVISTSFDKLGGAAADVASDDLPSAGVRVLRESVDPNDDEGRAMCQLVHDLAPGADLSFYAFGKSVGLFAQGIRDLADPSKGNCQVLVDDIVDVAAEPMFQDGLVAQAIAEVVKTQGVAYFVAAGNLASQSYENTAPQFIAGPGGARYLNFDPSGATQDITQRITIPDGATFNPSLQWADPFYSVKGVRTDLDIFLVAVKAGAAPDTVARSTTRNIRLGYPAEYAPFTNAVSQTGTTAFDLVITLKSGQVPSRLKYINLNQTARLPTVTEWDTQSSTITGHAVAAEAFTVGAVPYFNQQVPESFTSKGGTLTLLFAPDSTALTTPVQRRKPNGAAADGVNNTFFQTDFENDGFPNFFGTSAAAPHAAAVAALLLSAEPGLTPAQVYGRVAGSARPLTGDPTGDFTGPGLVDAFTTLHGPVVAVAPPLAEGFEQGALPTSWLVYGTGAARVQDTTLAPATGRRSLVLDAEPAIRNARYMALTEATLRVRGAAAGTLTLRFSARKFAAETDEPMPASFTGHSNTDGVALSVDAGATWYRVADLTGANALTTYQAQTINLSQLASANGLALGNDVRLRFQRYGLGGVMNPTDPTATGRAFDDIALNGTVLSLSSAAASAAGLEAWPVHASGGSALHLRLPAGRDPAQVQLLDNLGRVLWQHQLAPSRLPWEGSVPLPAAAGLYHVRYQPAGGPAAARRVVVQ
jgi:hypothetical protein